MSFDEETLEHGGAERTLTISWDSLARLEAYEALGSVEYLAALVREHEVAKHIHASHTLMWDGCCIYCDAKVAHDEAERLMEGV